jgi:indolepyruvate decarboxylase
VNDKRIGNYLLQRLHEAGIGHVFGVPGDYVLRFYELLAASPLRHIGTTREDTAAFAADGYARCRGLGAVAVTYGVGALNVVNAVAGAFAESSPVVVVSGAPGVREQRADPMLHHRFGPFRFQREIFQRITCATAVLDDPVTALREIDRTLEAARLNSQPVYIELPRDMVDAEGFPFPRETRAPPPADADALAEAVEETLAHLRPAQAPAVLAGVELHRRGLQDLLTEFVRAGCLPVAATLTGKSVIGERDPAYLGVYEGAMGAEDVRRRIEEADLLLMLGVVPNDVDTGIHTARLDPNRIVRASRDEVCVRHHRYPQVYLKDFLAALRAAVAPRECAWPQLPPLAALAPPRPGHRMTIERLIASLNAALTPDMSVVADVGDCLFSALELRVHARTQFLASAFYTSMGFAVPAALGAQTANPELRPFILVGDGAFQMTGTELSTIARIGLDPIVIVLNNSGYGTERFILDGPFNDIAPWNFHALGALCGPIAGYEAATEDEFAAALAQALAARGMPSIINLHLPKDEASPAMRRLAERLGRRVAG